MKYLLGFLFSFNVVFGFADTKDDIQNYILKYHRLAQKEMKRHGVPASITLAQGLLESGYGKSKLAIKARNHFGIKCTSSWKGRSMRMDDDKKDECFRKYSSVKKSYIDHSLFLKRDRYASLFALDIKDYKAWAFGLKKCGYATNPKYAELLIGIINKYDLHKYDNKKYKSKNK